MSVGCSLFVVVVVVVYGDGIELDYLNFNVKFGNDLGWDCMVNFSFFCEDGGELEGMWDVYEIMVVGVVLVCGNFGGFIGIVLM